MKKKTGGIVLIFSIVIGFLIYVSIPSLVYRDQFRKGNQIIKKIEHYQISNHRLPDSLEDVGEKVDEEGPIYYKKISEDEYYLWFGTVLGESIKYSSESGKWQ